MKRIRMLPRRRLKVNRFTASWQELQKFCRDKATWPQAILDADKLVDMALKKQHFKGKTMGERLVAAQNNLSDNDMIWTAHNMAKHVLANPSAPLRERDVKLALVGFRQALRDLGAFSGEMYHRAISSSSEEAKS